MLARMWRKQKTPPLLVELQVFKLTLEISLAVLQKIGHCTTRGSHNTILGIYPEAVPTSKTHVHYVHSSLIYSSQKLERIQMPVNRKCLQNCGTFTQRSTTTNSTAIKKNEFMKFIGKWLDLESIILCEVTQSQKNANDMYSLISGY